MKALVALVLFLAVPSALSAAPATHASSPLASALERHPTASVLLFCAIAIGTVVLAFGIGVLVYKVIGPVRARPARRVL